MFVKLHEWEMQERAKKEGIEQGLEQGLEQGREQAREETAKKLIQNNIDLQIIADSTQLPLQRIQELQKEINSNIL